MARFLGVFALFVVILICSGGGCSGMKTIVWDQSTLVQVQKDASYARMTRLVNGDILCAFEKAGRVWVSRSRDDGKTWGEPIYVAKSPSGDTSNPELLPLENGSILFFYNERPNDGKHHFAIQVSISKDQGQTWRHLSQAYTADTAWDNGCWEPSAIQLPSGEIQLFFANENPYRNSKEQEISLVRSFNHGESWTEAKAISFRSGHRDGMPVPMILRDGKGIIVAIEDNGHSLMFHPVIIYGSLEDNWKQSAAGGASPRRWRAVKRPISEEWGGAPYVRQMPSGEVVLSFQSSVGREYPQMVVYVGDENAKNFEGRSVPFAVPSKEGGWWGSLFVKDDRTITAMSSCNGGVWAIDGHIEDRP